MPATNQSTFMLNILLPTLRLARGRSNHSIFPRDRTLRRRWRSPCRLVSYLALIGFSFAHIAAVPKAPPSPADGEYVGMRALSSKFAEGTEIWFHEILLTINGSNVSMEAIP